MIRQLTKQDIPECVNVIRTSFLTVGKEFNITPENAPRFTAYATDEAKVNSWMDEQHRPMFGYFDNGKMVGYYNLAFPTAKECELGSLCVLPEYRHSGIGGVLLNDALERAKALGFPKMKLSIVEENTVLRKWYEDHGFTHTGTEKFDFFPFTCGYLEISLLETDSFIDALLSGKTDKIPDGYDWFAPLIGDWDCDYYDEYDGQKRYVKGEWIFRRILEGAGIQDIFIFPSRATKEKNPQPDGEYGTSFRMFNAKDKCYDVCYTCDHCMKRLCFTKEGDKLVGKVLDQEDTYWIFSDITSDSFKWENVVIRKDGTRIQECEIHGKRIKCG